MKFRVRGIPKFVDRLIHAIGIILVLLAVAIGLASTPWFRHILEDRVQASLEEITGGKVEIVGMGFQPLDLKVSARLVIVHGRETNPEQPLFAARNVVIKVSPVSLMRFRLLLRTLAWQQADIRLATYPDGSTNLPGTRAAPESGNALQGLMDLEIHALTLAHTTFRWNNHRLPFEAAARNVSILLRHSGDGHYRGTIASSKTVFNSKSRTLPPVSFATTFQLSANQVRVSSLGWQIANLRGQARGSFHWGRQFAGDFDFRTNGGLAQLTSALRIKNIKKGYLYLKGKGSYGQNGLSVRGRVEAREFDAAIPQFKPGVVSLSSDYVLEKQRLTLTGIAFAGLEGRAQGKATVAYHDSFPSLTFSGQLENLSLHSLLQSIPAASGAIGVLHPWARISGTARGTWRQRSGFRSQFDLQFHAPPPTEVASGSLPLDGSAKGSVALGRETLLDIQEARISTPDSTLEAQGAFGAPDSSLAVKMETSNFDEWRSLASILVKTQKPVSVVLRSNAIFTGNVSGTFRHPKIDGHLETGRFDYGGWPWDGFEANVFGASDRTQISSGRLKLGTSTLTLDAQASLIHWTLQPDSLIHLKAAARETPVAGLRAALNLKPAMQGLLTGQIQAEGTLENLSGAGEFVVHKGEFAGVPFDLLSATIRVARSAWEINHLRIFEGRGQANGQLRLDPVQRAFSAQLHGRNFPLSQLHLLHPAGAAPDAAGAVLGLVNFDVNGEGSFDNARVHSTLDIRQLAWRGQALGNVRGSADWQGNQIQIQIEGGGTGGKIRLSGNIETGNNWPLQVSGQYIDFRLDPWIAQFVAHSLDAQIVASGSFNLRGPFSQASHITAGGQVQHLEINFPAIKMTNESPIPVQFVGQQLKFGRVRMQGPSTNLAVGGSIRFSHPSALNLTAQGETAATLLSLLSPQIQATGKSTLEVHIGGTPAHPQMAGTVDIKDVNLGYGDLPFRVNALNGKIRLDGERGDISSLKGTIGGGTVRFSGYVALQDVLRYQIRTQLSQVRVRFPSDFTSLLDGNLALRGTTARGQLTGDIAIRNIFVDENLDLIDLMAGQNRPLARSPLGVAMPFASRISLNVRVASARPVRIETHNLRLVSDVDTHLQGTLADPVAVGNVYLRSGAAIFRGNRYTLSRGEISMTNPFETEPVLDLQVHTTIEKYDLTLEVSGPPDRIRLSYRSDPPLPTEDILSLLAFGYSRRLDEFAPASGNSFSSMGASALLSQALSSQVTGRVQRLFGVSRVKLSPYSQELGTLGGPVLTIEQQLSPQLTLTYQTTTANSQYRVFEFEWTVNPRMSVRGFRDQNGIFGLELKFRKRFK